jgi:hypothetical protein
VFLDIKKAFDTTWHSGLLYKFSESGFSTSATKIISSFLTERKFKVLVEGEFSTPRKLAARVLQDSALSPIFCTSHINDASAAPGTHLALFADDICI